MRVILSTIFLCTLFVQGFAQSLTTSPLSAAGIGEIAPLEITRQRGMGGASIANVNRYHANATNPAALPYLYYPTFATSVAANLSSFSTNGQNLSTNSIYVRNFTLAIPVSFRRAAVAINIQPFSLKGYEISVPAVDVNGDSLYYEYTGDGGLRRINLNFGYELFKSDSAKHKLSFGGKFNYYFGKLYDEERIESLATPAPFNSKRIQSNVVSDVAVEGGLMYRGRLFQNPKDSVEFAYLHLGLIYRPETSLLNNQTTTYTNFDGRNFIVPKDTSVNSTVGNDILLPQQIGVGASFDLYGNLTVAADFRTTEWSKLQFGAENKNVADLTSIRFGAEYVKEDNPNVKQFKERVHYRLGARYQNGYFTPGGQPLDELGISFGLGLPINQKYTMSSFNFAVEVGQRSNTAGSLTEQFANFTFGLSLTPHRLRDRWFYKRRIN